MCSLSLFIWSLLTLITAQTFDAPTLIRALNRNPMNVKQNYKYFTLLLLKVSHKDQC